jgi:tRNA(fMet)-specific endonuclease VapC
MRRPGAQLILDTNVLVHWMRGDATYRHLVEEYDLAARRPRPIVPVVVVGELQAFVRWRGWGPAKTDALAALLSTLPRANISAEPVLEAYADLDCTSRRLGREMGKNDLWIAAVARVVGGGLLTSDKDFDHLAAAGVDIERYDPLAPSKDPQA